jgi:hypothetical protein
MLQSIIIARVEMILSITNEVLVMIVLLCFCPCDHANDLLPFQQTSHSAVEHVQVLPHSHSHMIKIKTNQALFIQCISDMECNITCFAGGGETNKIQ